MGMFDDPGEELDWLDEELLDLLAEDEEEEPEEAEPPRKIRRPAPPPETMADRQAVYVEKKQRKKANRGLKFLAFCELLAILGLVWWWIKWLY